MLRGYNNCNPIPSTSVVWDPPVGWDPALFASLVPCGKVAWIPLTLHHHKINPNILHFPHQIICIAQIIFKNSPFFSFNTRRVSWGPNVSKKDILSLIGLFFLFSLCRLNSMEPLGIPLRTWALKLKKGFKHTHSLTLRDRRVGKRNR